MALTATRILDWIVTDPNLDKNMLRASMYGAYDFFRQQTNIGVEGGGIISRELWDTALRSLGTNVLVPVINYDADVTIGNARSCVIADDVNTSAMYQVTFVPLTWGFTMVPTEYDNNYISYNRDFDNKMRKYLYKVAATLDEMAVAALTAAKTQVFNNPLYYTINADIVECTWELREALFGDLIIMMNENDYYGQMHLIGNGGVKSIIQKLSEHGIYNDVNRQLEYSNYIMHFTNTQRLPNEAGKYATGFVVEDGQVGILVRIPDREARKGTNSFQHRWSVERLPFIDIPVAIHEYEDVGDYSAIGGEATADMVCVVKEHFGFSIDIAFITPYNSAPTVVPNPIIMFNVAASDAANPYAFPVIVES